MAMTDEEILSAAARLRAAKRRRVAKTCEVCGTPFEGIAQRRYCSDACRVRASRARRGGPGTTDAAGDETAFPSCGKDESLVDYFGRLRDYNGRHGPIFGGDSTKLVLQGRMERTLELMRATGASGEEIERERAEWEREYGWVRDDPPEGSKAMNHIEADVAALPPDGRARDRSVAIGPDSENERLRAEGVRRPGESSIEHVTRIRDRIMRGRVMPDESVDILRELRDERSKHLDTL